MHAPTQQRYAAMESLWAQLDAVWAQTGGAMRYADARKLANVILQAQAACYAQLEKAGYPRNLLSEVWHKDSLDVYANGVKSFVVTWDCPAGEYVAFATPVDA